jgi:hypothetical protein
MEKIKTEISVYIFDWIEEPGTGVLVMIDCQLVRNCQDFVLIPGMEEIDGVLGNGCIDYNLT